MNNAKVIGMTVGGGGIIIIRLVALFSLNRVQQGDEVRGEGIYRCVHFVSGGMLLFHSYILLKTTENSDSSSSLLMSWLSFYLFCRIEMVVYKIIEDLTEVSELNDPVTTQASSTLTRRHRHTTTSGREELNGISISFMKGLIAVCGVSLSEFFVWLAMGLSISSLQAWDTFGALVIHKFIVAFIVGTGLSAKECECWSSTIYFLVYTFLSSLGLCVATLFTIAEEDKVTSIAACYALAILTLTYLGYKLLHKEQDLLFIFRRAIFGNSGNAAATE